MKSGSDRAGWKGARTGLAVSNAAASLLVRPRRWVSGRSPFDFARKIAGESGGDSVSVLASSSRTQCFSQ